MAKSEKSVDRNDRVSSEVLETFFKSGETANMTKAEAAAHVKMNLGSFEQRLQKYRSAINGAVKHVEEIGGDVEKAKAWALTQLPVFKNAAKRSTNGKSGIQNRADAALLEFLKQ